MAVTLAIVAFAFFGAEVDANGSLILGNKGSLALIAANAYVFCFNFSWGGPVMWVMLGEMFPNQIRGSGLAVAGGSAMDGKFCHNHYFSYFTCFYWTRSGLWLLCIERRCVNNLCR